MAWRGARAPNRFRPPGKSGGGATRSAPRGCLTLAPKAPSQCRFAPALCTGNRQPNTTGAAAGDDHGHLTTNQVGGQRWQSIVIDIRPAIFDLYVLVLDIAGFF